MDENLLLYVVAAIAIVLLIAAIIQEKKFIKEYYHEVYRRMIEKKIVTTATVNGEETFKAIENISMRMVDSQDEMIMQTFASQIDKTFNEKFRDITVDRKKLERALLNATPQKPIKLCDTSALMCGSCAFLIRSDYKYCPVCGRKIKWKE